MMSCWLGSHDTAILIFDAHTRVRGIHALKKTMHNDHCAFCTRLVSSACTKLANAYPYSNCVGTESGNVILLSLLGQIFIIQHSWCRSAYQWYIDRCMSPGPTSTSILIGSVTSTCWSRWKRWLDGWKLSSLLLHQQCPGVQRGRNHYSEQSYSDFSYGLTRHGDPIFNPAMNQGGNA